MNAMLMVAAWIAAKHNQENPKENYICKIDCKPDYAFRESQRRDAKRKKAYAKATKHHIDWIWYFIQLIKFNIAKLYMDDYNFELYSLYMGRLRYGKKAHSFKGNMCSSWDYEKSWFMWEKSVEKYGLGYRKGNQ